MRRRVNTHNRNCPNGEDCIICQELSHGMMDLHQTLSWKKEIGEDTGISQPFYRSDSKIAHWKEVIADTLAYIVMCMTECQNIYTGINE